MFNISKYADILEKCINILNGHVESEEIVIESVESGRFKLLIDRGHVIFEKEDDVIGSGLLFSFNNEEKYTFVYRIKNQRFESVRLKDLLIETVHGNLTEESVLNIEKACFRGM